VETGTPKSPFIEYQEHSLTVRGIGVARAPHIAIIMNQLPTEKLLPQMASEAENPYPDLRLAKARATALAPRRAAVEHRLSTCDDDVGLGLFPRP